MSPDASFHLSLVTLGVADLDRARAFYVAMGLLRGDRDAPGIAFFRAGPVVLALYPRDRLAEDAALEPGGDLPAFRGLSLACNVPEADAVAVVIGRAVAAGGTCVKPAQAVFWGGTSGYFADPDGHLWEVAHNPFFPLDVEGRLTLPDAGA
ncbi:VOC family protein [Xanthobacter agilis]|uniref:Catechol 2,3-dioxygenase-like lactoylglutathione lyase family enzyme n=1 Tax=Xanthobacter agilis TaxID=47492 RepID=A0ABU0LFU1_XANAG|nr:VOC family protein [Xanthobacter agilis]MDQ0505935.1 catechol 2,3-dioxygenase-like lactoylglutathione lyase family enzyme [Xanthobacter agilis]